MNNKDSLIAIIRKTAKRRRIQKNISQEKLAALSKVSLASITRFETGKGSISLNNFISILNALDMSEALKEFFNEDRLTPMRTKSRLEQSLD